MSSAFFNNNNLTSSEYTNKVSRSNKFYNSDNSNCNINYFKDYTAYNNSIYVKNNKVNNDCSINFTFFDACSTILTDPSNDYFKFKCQSTSNVFCKNNIYNYSEYNYILDISNTIKGIYKLPYCGYDVSNINNNFSNYENYYKIINKFKLDCKISKPTFYSGISDEEYIKIINNNNKNIDDCS
jgi:hypothetical protein